MDPLVRYCQMQSTYSFLKDGELIDLVRRAAKDPVFYETIEKQVGNCPKHVKEEAERLIGAWKGYREEVESYMDREDIDQFLYTCFKWYFLAPSLQS